MIKSWNKKDNIQYWWGEMAPQWVDFSNSTSAILMSFANIECKLCIGRKLPCILFWWQVSPCLKPTHLRSVILDEHCTQIRNRPHLPSKVFKRVSKLMQIYWQSICGRDVCVKAWRSNQAFSHLLSPLKSIALKPSPQILLCH